MKRWILSATAALAAAGTLAACSSASAGSDSAPTLTLYSGQHVQTAQNLVAAFERQTGIKMAIRSDDEDPLADQIATEGSHSPADVFFTENTPPLESLQAKGLLSPVDKSTLSKAPARYSSAQGDWVAISARTSVIVYDPSLIKASALPTRISQFADPQYKGKLAIAPQETDFQPIVTAYDSAYGKAATLKWLGALKSNAAGHIYPDNETVVSDVNKGAIAFGLINQYYWYRIRAEIGASRVHSAITHLAPRDPGYVIDVSGAAVLKSSKHQAEAQRFLAFLVSKKGQEIIGTPGTGPNQSISFEYPLDSGVTTKAPETPFSQLQPSPITISQLGTGTTAISLMREAGAVSSPVLAPGAPPRQVTQPTAVVRPRRARRPVALIAIATVIAAALALPLVFLLIETSGAGLHTVASLIVRPLTGELLWNTVRLTLAVTAACAVIGTGAAFLVERTSLPLRRVWAVLLVIPLAIPDFVVSFGWSSLWTWAHGFRGAVLVMMLAVYPLVYLPVAASLRSADPGQEEVARSLGTGRVRTFVRITLGQARGAILGGCLLVALVLLAEYGAFELLGYQTFTTEIFTEFNLSFSVPAACALSLVLVGLSLLVLGGEGVLRGRGRVARMGAGAQRATAPLRLGKATWPALACLTALVALALGVPVYASIYWIFEGGIPSVTGGSVSMLDAIGHTALYGIGAGIIDTVAALPVAMLAIRHTGAARHFLERSTYLVLAMPGAVIGFALAYFTEHYAAGRGYQTAPLLVICYAIMFFPLALVGVKAAVARAPAGLDEVARSLGATRLATLRRVTLRLAGPGLVAAFCLVFLSVVTELTATLLLVPTGVQTLATQFWVYETDNSYAQAAPFALVMIAIAAVPSYVLGRFFDRSASARG